MCLINADLEEQCLDSKLKLCTIMTNIFIVKPLSSAFSYQLFRLCLPLLFPEGYNLLLLSSCWNAALLYSVCVFLPLLTLALAQMFAGTLGLNLVLFTYCDYTGNSHWLQGIFFKYDETFLPGGDSWENTSTVWKEVICFFKSEIIISHSLQGKKALDYS